MVSSVGTRYVKTVGSKIKTEFVRKSYIYFKKSGGYSENGTPDLSHPKRESNH